MFDRRFSQYFDWGILIFTIGLGAIGLLTLYSAVTSGAPCYQSILYVKQLIWYCIGTLFVALSLIFDYKLLDRWAYAIYTICIVLLICVLVGGKYVGGAKRWLSFAFISIQPSEMVKVAIIIVLAKYYSRHANTKGFSLRYLVKPMLLTLIPFILIVMQPDLGTALLIVLIAGLMTVFVKIEKKTFRYLVLVCALVIPLVWIFLKDYQKQRILSFLDPGSDSLGAGYHLIQSKIAIGSGAVFGKGFKKGTQNALSFLPEQHTDFIFSVMAEEWGFVGSIVLLFLFLILIIWGLNIAYACRDNFGTILCVGISVMLTLQVFINIGMVMGLMPVVGIPLPLISYGGSSIVTVMLCIGILMNVSMRRFVFE